MNHSQLIYEAYSAGAVKALDLYLSSDLYLDLNASFELAGSAIQLVDKGMLPEASERAGEAAVMSQDLWHPLSVAICAAKDCLDDAQLDLDALAKGSAGPHNGNLVALSWSWARDRAIVWGKTKHLQGSGGPVAFWLYEQLELEGTGITLELVNPRYRIGGSAYMTRDVVLKLAPIPDLTPAEKAKIEELDQVEAKLNEKGWSMG